MRRETKIQTRWSVVSAGRLAGFAVNESGVSSTSRGLVGDTVFAVLPTVKPIHTFAVTVAFRACAVAGAFRGVAS